MFRLDPTYYAINAIDNLIFEHNNFIAGDLDSYIALREIFWSANDEHGKAYDPWRNSFPLPDSFNLLIIFSYPFYRVSLMNILFNHYETNH